MPCFPIFVHVITEFGQIPDYLAKPGIKFSFHLLRELTRNTLISLAYFGKNRHFWGENRKIPDSTGKAGNCAPPLRQLASGCGRGFEPSAKRVRRNGVGSMRVGSPATMSATSFPAPGPIPKPCPENPVATTRPGRLSTGEMTGIASGITSI